MTGTKQSLFIIDIAVAILVLVVVIMYIVSVTKQNKLQNVVLQKDIVLLDN